jgi:uncharacterized Zn-finger protein
MRAHSGEKHFECEYPDCEKSFRERSNLLKHFNKHVSNKRFYSVIDLTIVRFSLEYVNEIL